MLRQPYPEVAHTLFTIFAVWFAAGGFFLMIWLWQIYRDRKHLKDQAPLFTPFTAGHTERYDCFGVVIPLDQLLPQIGSHVWIQTGLEDSGLYQIASVEKLLVLGFDPCSNEPRHSRSVEVYLHIVEPLSNDLIDRVRRAFGKDFKRDASTPEFRKFS